MSRTTVAQILRASDSPGKVEVKGWVRTKRDSKAFSFVEINDGSCLANLQIIADATIDGYDETAPRLRTGAAIAVSGEIVESQGKQKWEMQAASVTVLGDSDEDYPLQKKGHTPEFLRSIAHLRPRTNLFGAVFRMRSRMALAIHQFFNERGFTYVHTPIITASDCEGAGEMFRVTTLTGKELDKNPESDFFGKPTYLTVSGQLEGECFACALSNIYTFGPTFRAENSHTSRHASEFWMIEPEMAFCDLAEDMTLAEEMMHYLVNDALENCEEDLAFLNRFIDKELLERLAFVKDRDFERISYTDAVKLLEKSGKKFEFPVEYGLNLQSEHERFLTEEHFKCPVTVHDYPDTIKPFYMRRNDDEKTVAAMDLLVPGIGEIVGGSQREERLDVLKSNLEHHDLGEDEYGWYMDLRRYGSVPHAGFGLGFERLLMFVTGVANIRDVIPFPRVPGSADF